jgi:hypothetical protein
MAILDSNSVNPPVTLPKTRPVNQGVTRPRDLIGPQPCVWEQAIETLQQLDAVRHRIKKLEKHLQIAQLRVRMIQSELGFKEKRRRTA